jgi:hypothetical protein
LLVVIKESLNLILKPVSEFIEVFVLQQLLSSWSLLWVQTQAVTNECDSRTFLKATQTALQQVALILIDLYLWELYALK